MKPRGAGKKREERLEGELRSFPGILWKTGSPLRAWIASRPREQGLGGCHPTGRWSGEGLALESFVPEFRADSRGTGTGKPRDEGGEMGFEAREIRGGKLGLEEAPESLSETAQPQRFINIFRDSFAHSDIN